MENKKSLRELGEEYLTICEKLETRIRQLRREAKESSDNDAVFIMRRVYSLYSDLRRCRETAVKMINYYDKTEGTPKQRDNKTPNRHFRQVKSQER